MGTCALPALRLPMLRGSLRSSPCGPVLIRRDAGYSLRAGHATSAAIAGASERSMGIPPKMITDSEGNAVTIPG